MNAKKEILLRLVKLKAEQEAADLANEFVRSAQEEREAILAGLEFEKWLAESCKGGRYGSTQSTVLALKAIVAYDKARAKPKAAGSIEIIVDGKRVVSNP